MYVWEIYQKWKFIQLFESVGKYNKAEINQKRLWYCYAYTWFQVLKSLNFFPELIKTSLREVDWWWEVKYPLSDKNWKRIKVRNDEIWKNFSFTDENGKICNVNINSNTSLWFKILEIAFIKYYYSHKRANELEITWTVLNTLEWWETELFLNDIVWNINYIIDIDYKLKEKIFDIYNKWIIRIWLSLKNAKKNIAIKWQDNQKWIILDDVKIYWKKWELIISWLLRQKWKKYLTKFIDKNNSDILKYCGTDENSAIFYEEHAYSIERCFVDKNWVKKVIVVNPRHTWVKFEMTMKKCAQLFSRDIYLFKISEMFRNSLQISNLNLWNI